MQGISIDHNDNAIEKFKKHFTLNFWGFKYAGAIIKIDCYLVHCQIAQHNIKGLAKELQLQVFMRGSKKKNSPVAWGGAGRRANFIAVVLMGVGRG